MALVASGLAAAQSDVTIPGAEISGWGQVREVRGTFARPAGAKPKAPAVLILHGSNGVDGRGEFYAEALKEAGIATLELIMFVGATRPRPAHQASMPYAAAALTWLAARPDINGERLGVMGFSYGGVMSVLMASEAVQERLGKDVPRPAAFAPFYPVCTNMTRFLQSPRHPFYNVHARMRPAPMLIHMGTADDYERGQRSCDPLVAMWPPAARSRSTVRYVEGATHGFDSRSYRRFNDDGANGGHGGTVTVFPSPKDAADARKAVVAFFVENLDP